MRWLLATILFFSLWYSTTAHYLMFPEPSTFMSLREWDERSSLYGDTAEYEAMVDDFALAGSPFRYRVLPAVIVRAIRTVTGLPTIYSWQILNLFSFLAAGVAAVAYLSRYGFRWSYALLGGVLLVTLPSMQATTMLTTVDPLSLLLSVGIFWAARAQKPLLFVLVGVLAIWTKEVFLFGCILWFACYLYSPLSSRAWLWAARLWKLVMVTTRRRGSSQPII